jgi:hypothetical protein
MADRLGLGGIDRDAPPLPAPPDCPGPWTYDEPTHAFYSQAGGVLSGWNGYQLFRWEGGQWVDRTPDVNAGSEPQPPAKPTAGEQPARQTARQETVVPDARPPTPVIAPRLPSADEIERRIGSALDDFDKEPLPEEQARTDDSTQVEPSCESPEEPEDS